jgi:antitoxin ParD1/3/4
MCVKDLGIIETVGTGPDLSLQIWIFFLRKNNSILNIWCKFTPTKIIVMARQSITLANQNDEWLKQQISKEEFTSKSEAVNYLIKQAREREEYHNYVQMKIDRGIKSGYSTKTKEELLAEIKKRLNVSL